MYLVYKSIRLVPTRATGDLAAMSAAAASTAEVSCKALVKVALTRPNRWASRPSMVAPVRDRYDACPAASHNKSFT